MNADLPSRSDGQLEPNEAIEIIQPGMTVVDRNDSKIGEVAQVYRPVGVDEQNSMSYDAYIRVGHRGLAGLAKDIYVPARFVGSVTGDTVTIDVDKDQIPDFVWDQPVPLSGDNH
ncbi:MAG: DUF2171 domain-containing protein [Thermomicrobiales bacterium]|nr:DUF2171 domain-containing protein [Thermomicrobiales bacterium]